MRLYFAHPINIYNTPLEDAVMALIARTFPSVAIENPNQRHHQIGYKRYAEETGGGHTMHQGLDYFREKVLPLCDAVIAIPYLDNRFGSGVIGEVNWFTERGKDAYRLWVPQPVNWVALEEFTHLRRSFFGVRAFTYDEISLLSCLDPQVAISREETRLRTWVTYNRVIRPYEGAHLVSMPLPDDFYPQDVRQ